MEGLLARSSANGVLARDSLSGSPFRVGQQAAVQQNQRLCSSGKSLKELPLWHSSPRASMKVMHSECLSGFSLFRIVLREGKSQM